MSCLCNLGINPLLGASITNVFSNSVSCLLVLLMVFLAVQNFSVQLGPICLLLLLFLFPWKTDLRKCCYNLCLRMFYLYSQAIFVLPVFSSHFVQLSQLCCWRGCLFSFIYSCLLCHRSNDCRCVGLFLSSLFWFIGLYVQFCASTTLFRLPELCSII